jgi:hypothetical protein
MPKPRTLVPEHLKSTEKLSSFIEEKKLGRIDSREWKQEWNDGWVAYADLIGFAARAMRSDNVVLNNIVRFDRACQIVAEQFPEIRLRRFSDATFAISSTFSEVLGFSVALSHACLALNHEYLENLNKQFFIHTIAPRITVAKGRVLLLPDAPAHDPRYKGIDPRNVLAGSAIVRAYYLEKLSAGGLVTIDEDGIEAIQKLAVRGQRDRVTNGLNRWLKSLSNRDARDSGKVFGYRGKVLDVPWLLLQPIQNQYGSLWGALPADADFAIAAHLGVWDKSIREFYTPQNFDAPLDVVKHYESAIRLGVSCYGISNGRLKPGYETASVIMAKIHSA